MATEGPSPSPNLANLQTHHNEFWRWEVKRWQPQPVHCSPDCWGGGGDRPLPLPPPIPCRFHATATAGTPTPSKGPPSAWLGLLPTRQPAQGTSASRDRPQAGSMAFPDRTLSRAVVRGPLLDNPKENRGWMGSRKLLP